MPEVSVIMPVYNAAGTLPAAINSILQQSLPDFELVIADDGSTDASAKIAEAFAQSDPRIRLLSFPHRGLVPALNDAIAASRGKFIARMDADDESMQDRLQRQVKYLKTYPETGLVSGLVLFGGDEAAEGYRLHVDWINSMKKHDEMWLNRFRESPVAHPSVMFRREIFDRFGGYRQGDFPEDYELWLRWMDAGVRFGKVDTEVIRWNDPPERLSRTSGAYAPEAFNAVKAEWLSKWLKAENPHHPAVWIWGAGKRSRSRAKALEAYGICIDRWIDVKQKTDIIHYTDVPQPGKCFVVSYVNNRGAADEIRHFLSTLGYIEGKNFILAAG